MKKILAVILVLLLLISFACPVSALSSSDENTISGVELSIKRTKSKILGQSKIELANEILAELGLEDNLIEKLAEERKIEVADAYEIYRVDEYGKVYSDGSILPISKVEFDDYEIKNTENNMQKAQTPQEGYEYIEEDGTFHKQLYVIRTKNAPQGTYGIITAYQWKKTAYWKGIDVISISSNSLVFDKSSFAATVVYEKNKFSGVEGQYEYYDYPALQREDMLLAYNNAVVLKYNLPNCSFSEMTFLITVSSIIDKPSISAAFNVYVYYFHQKTVVSFNGISISEDGASVSVSPKTSYDSYYISTTSPILYNP